MAKKMTLYIPSSEGMIGIENGEKGAHNEGPIISKSVYIEIHATKKMQATYKRKWDVMKSLSFTISFISSIFIFINDFQWGLHVNNMIVHI